MGTKNNPGKYDCYDKLDPDEPYFVLRAKDPSAPYLIRIWEKLRNGNWVGAMYTLVMAMNYQPIHERVSTKTYNKINEAQNVAHGMEYWHQRNIMHEPKKEGNDEPPHR